MLVTGVGKRGCDRGCGTRGMKRLTAPFMPLAQGEGGLREDRGGGGKGGQQREGEDHVRCSEGGR